MTKFKRKRQSPSTTESTIPTNSTSSSSEPWSALMMSSAAFTAQWLHHNERKMWHLRVLEGNQIVPSFRKLFFRDDDTAALPMQILEAAIEPRLAVQVRHLVSPKQLYQTLQSARRDHLTQLYPSIIGIYEELIERPPPALFRMMNDLENSLCIDGRLGELREEYLTSVGSRGDWSPPDWSTMTRGEAKYLAQMLRSIEVKSFSYEVHLFEQMAACIRDQPGDAASSRESDAQAGLGIIRDVLERRSVDLWTALGRALADPDTNFRPEDPGSMRRVRLPAKLHEPEWFDAERHFWDT